MKYFYIVLLIAGIWLISIDFEKKYESFLKEYNHVLSINDKYELEVWIENNPDSHHIVLAKYFLEQFYWHDANYQNTVYAYDRYIEKYPNGKKKDIALRNRAIVKNDLSEYEKLLKTNPDDEQIRWRRDLLLMIHAQNENTKEAFQRFINKYPDSAFASTAQWYINNVYK